ncbi:iron-containing alcohol dehydrogenase [Providencia vermicola]
MSTIVLPRTLEIGHNSIKRLPNILQGLNCRKPLIVTDKMMVKLGYLSDLQSILSQAGIESDVYSDTVPEPTAASIQAGIDKVQSADFDAVVALGGGSPIDSAKAIAVIGKLGGLSMNTGFLDKSRSKVFPLLLFLRRREQAPNVPESPSLRMRKRMKN